jgi:hypothetical protein
MNVEMLVACLRRYSGIHLEEAEESHGTTDSSDDIRADYVTSNSPQLYCYIGTCHLC